MHIARSGSLFQESFTAVQAQESAALYKRMADGGQDWTSPDVSSGAGVLIGQVAASSLHTAVLGIELRNFMVKPLNRGNRTAKTLASAKNDRICDARVAFRRSLATYAQSLHAQLCYRAGIARKRRPPSCFPAPLRPVPSWASPLWTWTFQNRLSYSFGSMTRKPFIRLK